MKICKIREKLHRKHPKSARTRDQVTRRREFAKIRAEKLKITAKTRENLRGLKIFILRKKARGKKFQKNHRKVQKNPQKKTQWRQFKRVKVENEKFRHVVVVKLRFCLEKFSLQQIFP